MGGAELCERALDYLGAATGAVALAVVPLFLIPARRFRPLLCEEIVQPRRRVCGRIKLSEFPSDLFHREWPVGSIFFFSSDSHRGYPFLWYPSTLPMTEPN